MSCVPPSPPPLEAFVDRGLGRYLVPQALRDAGLVVHTMVEVFGSREQDVADDEWLERAGRDGWIVFTKDKRIRYRHVEIEAIRTHGVKAFVLASGNLTGQQQAARFVANLGRIRTVAQEDGPYVYAVHERRIARLDQA
jgi:PIN like domain